MGGGGGGGGGGARGGRGGRGGSSLIKLQAHGQSLYLRFAL